MSAFTEKRLLDTRNGDHVTVVAVNDDKARIQALRFGINPGAEIDVVAKVPGGPLVIKSGYQEIAIGRPLAAKIKVKYGNN